jgi:hypothetical protein
LKQPQNPETPMGQGRSPSYIDPQLSNLLDRAAMVQVVQDWGLARDTGRWDRLRACFAPGATMRTTWFAGSATEFVERSIAAAASGSRAQHFIGAASIEIDGDRALVETRMILMVRARLDGIEVDATCHGRFHDQFVRHQGQWRILHRVPIYEKDRLDVLDPARTIMLDPRRLAAHPEGYRHLAYLQAANGASITPDLPTPGSASLERLHAQGAAWLHAQADA